MYISQPYQTTLARSISCSGIGLHSARLVDLSLHPAPADTGIIFRRTDISNVDTEIRAVSSNIGDTMLNSQIMNDDGVGIGTIEHLMAAFAGLGVDNAYIDVNAAELPAMDGSAKPYCDMINEAGIVVSMLAIRCSASGNVASAWLAASWLPIIAPEVTISELTDIISAWAIAS